MPIDSRERIGPAVAAVVTDVGHESAPTEKWPAPDELNPPLDKPSRQHWTPEPRGWRRTTRKRRHDRPTRRRAAARQPRVDGADRSARLRDGDRAPLSERAQRPGSPGLQRDSGGAGETPR